MKQTALNEVHRALGARMVDYAGWDMPVQYASGPASESRACRTAAGIFDVSHMGEVRVTGSEALDFVQYVTSNDASRLSPGKAQYSLLLNEDGGVVDDIIVYRLDDAEFMIVINAGCKDKDLDWLRSYIRSFPGAVLEDISDRTGLLAVQGPDAPRLVDSAAGGGLLDLKRFQFRRASIDGVGVLASRTGYTGEDGLEIFCDWNDATALWRRFTGLGVIPCGLASRDILRIEASYPLYGHEIDPHTSPLGAGLQWAVKTSKKDFIGRNCVIERMQGITKETLAGLRVKEGVRAIPREGCVVYAPRAGRDIGVVTSGTLSPTLDCGIAIARIGAGWAQPGTPLELDIRGRRVPVEAAQLPFYRNGV